MIELKLTIDISERVAVALDTLAQCIVALPTYTPCEPQSAPKIAETPSAEESAADAPKAAESQSTRESAGDVPTAPAVSKAVPAAVKSAGAEDVRAIISVTRRRLLGTDVQAEADPAEWKKLNGAFAAQSMKIAGCKPSMLTGMSVMEFIEICGRIDRNSLGVYYLRDAKAPF